MGLARSSPRWVGFEEFCRLSSKQPFASTAVPRKREAVTAVHSQVRGWMERTLPHPTIHFRASDCALRAQERYIQHRNRPWDAGSRSTQARLPELGKPRASRRASSLMPRAASTNAMRRRAGICSGPGGFDFPVTAPRPSSGGRKPLTLNT